MGAFGEAFAAFAKPLIDQTDGSPEQLEKALSLSQLCYNTALLPAENREEMFAEMQARLGMEAEEFEDFRRSLLDPMIARHEEMFPRLHQGPREPSLAGGRSSWLEPRAAASPAKKSAVDRYAPCPCGSGKKYKFCCGKAR